MTQRLLHLVDVPGSLIDPDHEGVAQIVDTVPLKQLAVRMELANQGREVLPYLVSRESRERGA